MSDASLTKAETSNTTITFTKEKKAFWSFIRKCFKKCFGKKTESS